MLTRPPEPADLPTLALLHNATQEPHFHTTAARLAHADLSGHLVLEDAGEVIGFGTRRRLDFDPDRAWIGLHLHPDHRQADGARRLLNALVAPLPATIRQLWTSVREDYLGTAPDLTVLGFREVHRTFGGGFFLDPEGAAVEGRPAPPGVTIQPAQPWRDDPRLSALYATLAADKVTAPPTIPPASPALHDPDQLWTAGFVAVQAGQPIGLAVPERARLGAWNAVLGVRRDWRRRGIGTALQARVCGALRDLHFGFLNTAGVKADRAYLGVLRRLGATIEPDWIAYGRERP